MATQPLTARLRLDDTTTHTTNVLEWIATAALQDTPAGASVDVTITRTTAGVPPLDPDTLDLKFYDDAGALVRSAALNVTAASQTVSFFFTANGQSGGGDRAGTVEIALRATKAGVGAYDVETDGAPNDPPATFDSHLDRGWIRGTTTATVSVSNAAFGGAAPNPFAYDDDVFHRVVLGAAPFKSESVTHTVGTILSASSSSSAATFDGVFTKVTDNRFPIASSSQSASLAFPNSAFSGAPWTTATITPTPANYDPRLTVAHLLQINDSMFGTPPLSKNDPDDARATTELGFLSFRLRNARAEGINGVVADEQIRDQNELLAPGSFPARSATTSTQGGETGWGTGFLTWDNQLPAGIWVHKVTLTTADAIGLEVSPTKSYTLAALAAEAVQQVLDPVPLALRGIISYK